MADLLDEIGVAQRPAGAGSLSHQQRQLSIISPALAEVDRARGAAVDLGELDSIDVVR